MGFKDYIDDLRSFDFNGRMNRAKYWMYILYGFLLSWVIEFMLSMIVGIIGSEEVLLLSIVLSFVLYIVFAILTLPFTVRRLHDLNKSGWWYLIFLIPIINFFFGLYVGFFKGTDGTNQYGPDPLAK